MPVDRTVSVTSDSWQPDFICKHAADLSSYLEQVSRSSKSVADCAMELMAPLAGRKSWKLDAAMACSCRGLPRRSARAGA